VGCQREPVWDAGRVTHPDCDALTVVVKAWLVMYGSSDGVRACLLVSSPGHSSAIWKIASSGSSYNRNLWIDHLIGGAAYLPC
jgi:hypothetical protein